MNMQMRFQVDWSRDLDVASLNNQLEAQRLCSGSSTARPLAAICCKAEWIDVVVCLFGNDYLWSALACVPQQLV